jgi:hypothetical protein
MTWNRFWSQFHQLRPTGHGLAVSSHCRIGWQDKCGMRNTSPEIWTSACLRGVKIVKMWDSEGTTRFSCSEICMCSGNTMFGRKKRKVSELEGWYWEEWQNDTTRMDNNSVYSEPNNPSGRTKALGFYSACNRNEYQKHRNVSGSKAGGTWAPKMFPLQSTYFMTDFLEDITRAQNVIRSCLFAI